jgi:hypothetical protein
LFHHYEGPGDMKDQDEQIVFGDKAADAAITSHLAMTLRLRICYRKSKKKRKEKSKLNSGPS